MDHLKKCLLNLLQYCLCLMLGAFGLKHVRSSSPDRVKPQPLCWGEVLTAGDHRYPSYLGRWSPWCWQLARLSLLPLPCSSHHLQWTCFCCHHFAIGMLTACKPLRHDLTGSPFCFPLPRAEFITPSSDLLCCLPVISIPLLTGGLTVG